VDLIENISNEAAMEANLHDDKFDIIMDAL
jgi:hypothetical protein